MNGTSSSPVASSSSAPHANGLAEPSATDPSQKLQQEEYANGPTHSHDDAVQHDFDISSHLYTQGFSNAEWADCRVEAHFGSTRRVYGLHKLILSRSPTLAHYLRMNQGPDLVLVIGDPNISEDAFCTAIGYLYSSLARQRLTHDNARSVLAAATFLGLEDLAQMAFDLCRTLMYNLTNPTEIADWFTFLETTSSTPHQLYSPPSPTSDAPQLLYGPAAYHLRHQLMHYLTQSLPTLLAAFGSSQGSPPVQPAANGGMNYTASSSTPSSSTNGQQALIQVYAVLPFNVFKSVIESAEFPPGDMERFSFAKRCIVERKRRRGKDGEQEVAVLAFGSHGNAASNVQVVSRSKKGSKLWKVEG